MNQPRQLELSVAASEHRPQLDGVRCAAVAMVVLAHAGGSRWDSFGAYGVTLFFVLSAYLITGILLRERGERLGATFGTFYARRALRIFPAYFVLLAVLFAVNAPTMRSLWPWHALYATNWLYALTGLWPRGVAHLWTLSIEEQFYLAWPAIMLLIPIRHVGRAAVGLATLAVVMRWMLATVTSDPQRVVTPTFATLDAFAIGAWLAWRQFVAPSESRRRTMWWCLGCGTVLMLHASVLRGLSRGYVLILATERLGIGLVSVCLIEMAAARLLPRAFEWRPIRFIGTISYGIYLWHLPIVWGIARVVKDDPIARETARGGWAMLSLVSALTLAVACLSWFALELPANSLKRFFPYRARRPARRENVDRATPPDVALTHGAALP